MKKTSIKLVFLFLILLTNNSIVAQFVNLDYKWEENPKPYKATAEEQNFPEIILFQKISIELITNDKTHNGEYTLNHKKTFLNSDASIQKNNKVYIPSYEDNEILTNQIRIIQPDGKIIKITNKDIKEGEDEETGVKYKYYALEGMSKGAVIENITIIKDTKPNLSAFIYNIQQKSPLKEYDFELIYPSHLEFDFLLNNLDQKLVTTKTENEKTKHSFNLKNIKEIPSEKYSNEEGNKYKILFKLSANKYSGKYNLYGYKQFSEIVYELCYAPLSKNDDKLLKNFTKKINFTANNDKIRAIEDFIKNEIKYDKRADDEDFELVFKNKMVGFRGLTKVFAHIFNQNNIKFELVFTTNRFEEKFDQKFESYSFLDDFLFYFPDTNTFLDPTQIDHRYPQIAYQNTYNYGVFFKKINFNGVDLSDYEIKFIPSLKLTVDTQDINVDFTEDVNNPKINTNITFDGASAASFQYIPELIPAEKLEEFKNSIADSYSSNNPNKKVEIENGAFKHIGKEPFILKVNYTGNNHLEKAGNKILFKVGELIGPQTEMYQTNARELPIEIPFPHKYDRNITVKVPNGYQLKNLEKLNNKLQLELDGKVQAEFVTTFTYENNVLKIKNIEQYLLNEYPISKYDQYVKIINAAADFNKIVLILEKIN